MAKKEAAPEFAEAPDALVEVYIPEQDQELSVETVSINGRVTKIKRGEPTMVPANVRDVLLQAGLIRR